MLPKSEEGKAKDETVTITKLQKWQKKKQRQDSFQKIANHTEVAM